MSSTLEAGKQSFDNTIKLTDGIVEAGEEGGIFFKEWVILDNTTGQQYIVFKRYDKEQLSLLLSGCPSYATLDEKESRKLRKLESLEGTINYLNDCSK